MSEKTNDIERVKRVRDYWWRAAKSALMERDEARRRAAELAAWRDEAVRLCGERQCEKREMLQRWAEKARDESAELARQAIGLVRLVLDDPRAHPDCPIFRSELERLEREAGMTPDPRADPPAPNPEERRNA